MSLLARTMQIAGGFTFVIGIASACVSTEDLMNGDPEGGSNEPTAARGRCPDADPPRGSFCFLPEGTTCLFGPCGAPIARCMGGLWQYSSLDHKPPCPDKVPDIDEVCPSCWPAGATCTYGSVDCTAADASANRAIASCEPGAKWTVTFEPCRDGGADVQGD